MSPKFKEGEVVILQSTAHPEYSGEYSLRKKHNPSLMSYQELMTNLSTKIQERI